MVETIERAETVTKLTRRQVQCLELAAEGLTFAQIGARVGLSANTVKGHLTAARRILGAGNVTRAVAEAIRRGLIQ